MEANARTAFVPHGFPDVLWMAGVPWIGGTYCAAVVESGSAEDTVIGIALRPGVIASWTGISPAELLGKRIPLAARFPAMAQRLTDAVGNAKDPELMSLRIEETIANEFASLQAPPNAYAQIRQALEPADGSTPTTRQIARAMETSERTLRRRCEHLFGYGPKTLQRVLRMQRFLRLARACSNSSVAALAHAAGFSDQAHLTREARALTALTPKSIVASLAESFKTEGERYPMLAR